MYFCQYCAIFYFIGCISIHLCCFVKCLCDNVENCELNLINVYSSYIVDTYCNWFPLQYKAQLESLMVIGFASDYYFLFKFSCLQNIIYKADYEASLKGREITICTMCVHACVCPCVRECVTQFSLKLIQLHIFGKF